MLKKILICNETNNNYNTSILNKLKNKLKQYEYITCQSSKIHEFVKEIFIVINLADTPDFFFENNLGSLLNKDIAIIYNFSNFCKKWENIEDIISIIREYDKDDNRDQITIISEDYYSNGGFGTYAYSLFNKIKYENAKLIYISKNIKDHENVIKLNNNKITSIMIPI